MPSFPPPGSATICEINRDLITAEQISEEGAKDTYGKVLGVVFNPIQFEPDNLLPNIEQANNDEDNRAKKDPLSLLTKIIFPPTDVKLLGEIDLQGVSWHQHKNLLAFISGSNQVTVCDYEDSDGKDPYILTNESQKDIRVLDWRPNGGKTLVVACKNGICIWSASYPGSVACVRSGIASFAGTLSRASGVRWTMVDFLRCPNNEQISALSWSPDGRYLASASLESSSFTIWDVAQGLGTPIRRGLGGISLLKWSPMGDYFFTAKFDGTFYLWETNTWTSETWSSTGGFVTGATWDPDGHMILLAFSESVALGSIHFASRPPSLDAHLLPVELPEVVSLTNSKGIEKISWDASGERLAVSYKVGDEKYHGLIAIYDVRRSPLITASLIGFIRGPGECPKPLAFSFHDKFKQGPLLSCWSSGWCCTYPLIFR
ncbi:aladin-like isoform X2 [Papaver somniferum]|uniref:aladin-like isoform X2 n=1 Tax=Papaver somniferum TaxID=3469 RepID=UPI000E701DE2|nr:aladin-like isoform X2 [Papaver somniferum]